MVSDAELDEFVKEIEAEKEEAGKYIANATCRSASRASAAHLRFDRDVDRAGCVPSCTGGRDFVHRIFSFSAPLG